MKRFRTSQTDIINSIERINDIRKNSNFILLYTISSGNHGVDLIRLNGVPQRTSLVKDLSMSDLSLFLKGITSILTLDLNV
jgi:hypothetical protein